MLDFFSLFGTYDEFRLIAAVSNGVCVLVAWCFIRRLAGI
jgi:hypothetical protein